MFWKCYSFQEVNLEMAYFSCLNTFSFTGENILQKVYTSPLILLMLTLYLASAIVSIAFGISY